MVAALGKMSEMAVAADKPSMAAISPKLSKDGTLLHILGCVAMAARVALGSVFHLGTGGVFLGDGSREIDGERNEISVASVGIEYPGHINPADDYDDCLTNRSSRRGF